MRIFTLSLLIFLLYSCNNNKQNDRRSDRKQDDYRNYDGAEKEPAKDNFNFEDDEKQPAKEKWSRTDIADFNRDCEKNMSEIKGMSARQMEKYCNCLLEKFQDKYDSYAEMETKSTFEEGKVVGDECVSLISVKKDDNNRNREASSGWTESERQQWMDDCAESVGNKMNSQIKQEYCSCVLEKLESRYDNYDEVNTRGTKQEGIELGKECIKEMGLK